MTLNKKNTQCAERAFALIKGTISYAIHKYGYRSANYSVILHDGDNAPNTINLNEACSSVSSLQNRVEALQKPHASPRLYEDLCAARDAFKSPVVRTKAKKVRYLYLFINNSMNCNIWSRGITVMMVVIFPNVFGVSCSWFWLSFSRTFY